MPKRMLVGLSGLILLTGATLAFNANATPSVVVGSTLASSPIQNVACACGPYRCACGHPYYRRGYYAAPYRRCWWRAGVRVCG
jgi:hypothetical protein